MKRLNYLAQVWWVAFIDTEYHQAAIEGLQWAIYRAFTRPGYRHCMLYTIHDDSWFFVDPLAGRLTFDMVPPQEWCKWPHPDIHDNVFEFATSIVQYRTSANYNFLPRWVPMTCVGVVKWVLGVKAPCVTPYGLYHWLMANGGIDIGSSPGNRVDLFPGHQEGAEGPEGVPG